MSAQNDILAGIDLSALTSVSQEQLMQLVNKASPLSNVGFIYVGTTRPDITNNPRMIRYLWLDITDPAVPVLKRYIGDRTSLVDSDVSWEDASISDGAVTTASLASRSTTGGVTIGHIKTNSGYTDAGNANYVLVVAANGKDVTAVTLDTALSNGGGVALNRLSTSGISAGKFIGYSSGVAGWVNIVPSTDLVGSQRIALETNVVPGTAYYVPRTNSGATALEYVTPDNLFVAGSQMLSLNKLSTSGAAANDVIRYSGSAWERVATGLRITNSDAANAGVQLATTIATITAAGLTIPHGFTATIPKIVRVVIKNTSGGSSDGWAANTEIPIEFLHDSGTVSHRAFNFGCDGTNIYLSSRQNYSSVGPEVNCMNFPTGAPANLTKANWTFKYYAWA